MHPATDVGTASRILYLINPSGRAHINAHKPEKDELLDMLMFSIRKRRNKENNRKQHHNT